MSKARESNSRTSGVSVCVASVIKTPAKPERFVIKLRAMALGWYPSISAQANTRARVASAIEASV